MNVVRRVQSFRQAKLADMESALAFDRWLHLGPNLYEATQLASSTKSLPFPGEDEVFFPADENLTE
jgi:hypothetical protein